MVNTGLAYTLWFRGISRLPATTMPMLGLLSPVVAISVGFIFLQQQLGLPQLLGAALVLGSVVLSQGLRQPAPPQAEVVVEGYKQLEK